MIGILDNGDLTPPKLSRHSTSEMSPIAKLATCELRGGGLECVIIVIGILADCDLLPPNLSRQSKSEMSPIAKLATCEIWGGELLECGTTAYWSGVSLIANLATCEIWGGKLECGTTAYWSGVLVQKQVMCVKKIKNGD